MNKRIIFDHRRRIRKNLCSSTLPKGTTQPVAAKNFLLFHFAVIPILDLFVLLIATWMLRLMDVEVFRQNAEGPSFLEKIALATEN
jgi:hypothetical protein